MTVQVFAPQISVILRKNIGRATVAGTIAASQRFQGTARTIELTPYLGEKGGVTVSKNVRDAMGTWTHRQRLIDRRARVRWCAASAA